MKRQDKILSIVFVAVSLALVIGGAWAVFAESAGYFVYGTTFQRLAGTDNPLQMAGVSPRSQQDYLLECNSTLSNWELLTEPEAERHHVAVNCLAAADGIIASSPTYALASFIAAFAAARLEDWPTMSARLTLSQATGPSEQYLAEMRTNLAEENLGRLDTLAMAAHDRDLRLLAVSRLGLKSIAQRYMRDPSFRERITAILETVDEADQRRFLSNIRRLMPQTS